MRRVGIWALVLSVLACSEDTAPVDPVWGKQPCDACRMIVSEPRHAAELLDGSGQRRFFDDIGCLVEYLSEHGDRGSAWVRSVDGRWIDARAARYVTGTRTPMDYGFAASPEGTADFEAVMRAVRAGRPAVRP